MDLLKFKKLLPLIVLSLSSCAKVGYMIDQGKGQLALQASARPNEVVLKDPRVPSKNKKKIELILKAKKYFYDYFGRPATGIYSKTTVLEREMVTTLVIASPYNRIEARKECFPLVGCFPYLGFFEPEDAKEYASDLEKEGLVTYSRPVYAYSTLGHFEDTILSSFFYYSDEDLVELVFHELFHTIFFVTDEVDLNENLANYYGEELRALYLGWGEGQRSQQQREKANDEALSRLIVAQAAELSARYQKEPSATRERSNEILESFLAQSFNPSVDLFCQKHQLQEKMCWPRTRTWNNASFAAFLTYEKKAQRISELRRELNLDLKELFALLEKAYRCYDSLASSEKDNLSFEKLLFEERDRLCPDI